MEIEKNVEEEITCVATGHPPAKLVSWFFNDEVSPSQTLGNIFKHRFIFNRAFCYVLNYFNDIKLQTCIFVANGY